MLLETTNAELLNHKLTNQTGNPPLMCVTATEVSGLVVRRMCI